MDVAGALLPFTQLVRSDLTVHVQEVLTQATQPPSAADLHKPKIPEIKEPSDRSDEDMKSPVKVGDEGNVEGKNGRCGSPA
ncbi:hypothetical protein RR48_05997 [Papilio machaon]|uniref:Uncharacterized protein n=1 Tax=Papilio machaon TaxID=76193 RepID=A0A194REN4_PAPMA|nr:hypothetical protein RR48_05997 [Papilio machaon]